MPPTFKLFIGGKWLASSSGETFSDINPADTSDILAHFQKATRDDLNHAAEAAQKGYEKWSSIPAPQRARVLFRTTELLRKRKEELAKLLTREMGKVLPEARGDVQEAIDIFEYCAGEGRRLFGQTTPSELPNKFAAWIRRPIGVVALITPWNFPFAIPAWKLAPALICGNGVILKPASDTPLCSLRLVEILHEAGLPPGVLNFITGPGEELGKAIVSNPQIRAVSFTGHRDTGSWLASECGRNLKRVSLEMGGKNPIIILPDANLDLAVDGVIWGGFGTSGQRCTAASRVIIHEKIKKDFEKLFLARAKKLRLGPGLTSSTDVGPVINEKQLKKIHSYTEIGKREGAKLLLGGNIIEAVEEKHGYFYAPTIFTDVSKDMRIAQEEIFGPTVSLIPVSNIDEAIDVANSVEYGLSSSIYTSNISNAFKAIEKIESGITYINSSTIGAEVHLPFGGVKSTGNGTREAGPTAIEEFSEIKAIYIDYSGHLQRAQIDVGD